MMIVRKQHGAASFLVRLGSILSLAGVLSASSANAATAARGYTGTQVFSTVGGDKDEGEPNHCGEAGGASSWFFYKAPGSGVMVVDTKGSSFDTVMAVYIGPGTSYATLTNVACNNDSGAGEPWSKVVFDVTAGTMYYIAVDGVGGASGTVKLNYQLGDPLAITNQPQGLVQVVGAGASFAVAASGLAPLRYQWLYEGAALNGATQSSLTLPSVELVQEGLYSVLVQDSASSLLSESAKLVVCPQAPGTNAVCVNEVLVNGTMYLRAVSQAAAGAVLEASDNLIDWLPIGTNVATQGLFAHDEPLDQAQRYFRVRLAP